MHADVKRHGEAGFTLIEAIIALVVLGVVLAAFFDFLSGTLLGARRIEAASTAYDHRTNALEVASAINPMELPEGSLKLGPYHINWSSKPIGDVRQSSGYPGGAGIFKVALYRVTLTFPDDAGIAPVEVTRLGFRRDNVPLTPFGDLDQTGPNQIGSGSR